MKDQYKLISYILLIVVFGLSAIIYIQYNQIHYLKEEIKVIIKINK